MAIRQGIVKAIRKVADLVDGREQLSPESMTNQMPMERSISEQIRHMVHQEVSYAAASAGAESFEEADDFDIEDEDDFYSPYENEFDPSIQQPVSKGFIEERPVTKEPPEEVSQNKEGSEQNEKEA